MARPKSFDPIDAYDQLLELFWRNGLAAMSVKRMSDHLGLTRSSFYNAFGTREALLKNLILFYEMQSPQIALVLAYPPIDVGALFEMLILELCTQHRQDQDRKGCLLTNLSVELRDDEVELQNLLNQINEDRIARLVEICQWAVDAKELPRSTNCQKLGQQLFALIEQINLLARSLPDLDQLEPLALSHLRQLWIKARP
jgi:TetR/AcrR family transcriptional repressor of nem operon